MRERGGKGEGREREMVDPFFKKEKLFNSDDGDDSIRYSKLAISEFGGSTGGFFYRFFFRLSLMAVGCFFFFVLSLFFFLRLLNRNSDVFGNVDLLCFD